MYTQKQVTVLTLSLSFWTLGRGDNICLFFPPQTDKTIFTRYFYRINRTISTLLDDSNSFMEKTKRHIVVANTLFSRPPSFPSATSDFSVTQGNCQLSTARNSHLLFKIIRAAKLLHQTRAYYYTDYMLEIKMWETEKNRESMYTEE